MPKISKISKSTKIGPISNIGPNIPRAVGQARKSKESKNSVATPPRVRRRAAATVPAFDHYSTYVRPLQSLRSAATVPAFGRYSPYVRPLQYPRAAATVPPCGRYSTPVPGSDQFHEETGTSNARTDSPRRGDRNKSDHTKNRATVAAGGSDGRSAAA
ncbi:hypothetical protein F511_45507 [Dorcoceras hygrometricum]|uniref:Uncharacterized protein n=1 Tax=Dorcoceras hygrometricum TaxID=472368 RepID=A0A2Z6ZWA9_9LAMI|nr:hypothetical protein F511_45507 [Dorcoceras hygrometricum]